MMTEKFISNFLSHYIPFVMKIIRELIVLQPFLNFRLANIIFTEIVSLKETAFSREYFSHAHFRSSIYVLLFVK
jgi:hypothetical protein